MRCMLCFSQELDIREKHEGNMRIMVYKCARCGFEFTVEMAGDKRGMMDAKEERKESDKETKGKEA